jgi:hypothetical protein
MTKKLQPTKKSHSAIKAANAYRAALTRLIREEPTHPKHSGNKVKITPAAVAREANRSRNPLYTTHQDILEEIQAAAELPLTSNDDHLEKKELKVLIEKNKELRKEIAQLTKDKQLLATENLSLLHRTLTAEDRVKTLSKGRNSITKLPK